MSLWREAIIAARFGLVGIAATIIHILVVSVLLSETLLPTLLANTLAFFMAFGISFAGNYIWTFQSPGQPQRVMGRFLLISLSAFCANILILSVILGNAWLSRKSAVVASAAIMPLITFVASRLWGFQYVSQKVDLHEPIPRENF